MIKRIVIFSLMLCAGAGIATNTPAQEETREQVRQELIEAESNGLNSVTDASSRDEFTHFQRQVLSLLGVPEHAFHSPR